MSAGHGVEPEEDTIVSLHDVLEEDEELENTANAVLGDSDDSECSYSKGYASRQALYACGTCVSAASEEPAGVCLACSLHCHEGHQLYELYTKRDFRCDCGNSKFPGFTCTLDPSKDPLNPKNKYNHNFRGLYCTCNRPYPDEEDEVEDEMIQCIMCEDWFHSRHLQGEAPPTYEEMVCDCCMQSHDFLWYYQLHTMPTTVTKETSQSSTHSPLQVIDATESGTKSEHTNGAGSSSRSETDIKVKADTIDSNSKTGNGEGPSPKQLSDGSHTCELSRRKTLSHQSAPPTAAAGYFDRDWRSRLCTCPACKETYQARDCLFLLDLSDSLSAYEQRPRTSPNSHEAAVAALSNMGRVQQVEAIHHYSELKTELSEFLNSFAQQKRVVSKRDIEEFFEGMHQRKRTRLESGEGVPPANCHF